MKWVKKLPRKLKLCLGRNLEGSVKSYCAFDIGVSCVMTIMQIAALFWGDKQWLVDWIKLKEEDPLRFYARPVNWCYFYFYFFSSAFLSWKLHKMASQRKQAFIYKYLQCSLLLYVPWIVFTCIQIFWIRWENSRGVAGFAAYTLYKVYSFWLVWRFLKEVTHFGDLCNEFRKILDKEANSFLETLSKVNTIGKERLKIDFSQVLGRSEQETEVFKAILLPDPQTSSTTNAEGAYAVYVALKSTSTNSSITHYKCMISEAKILSKLPPHAHIVNFYGICAHDLENRQFSVAVEYCPLGSLDNYLRRRTFFPGSQTMGADFCTSDLIKWSFQMAEGMEHLVNNGVIHGDLAARNVLLTANRDLKIADFGLSRQLYLYTEYTGHHNERLPWRWMAPESLLEHKFSHKSDVWSFGITLWEFFTLGKTPFQQYSPNTYQNFLTDLESGDLELECPPHASDPIYQMMLTCFNHNPDLRPTFDELKQFFMTYQQQRNDGILGPTIPHDHDESHQGVQYSTIRHQIGIRLDDYI